MNTLYITIILMCSCYVVAAISALLAGIHLIYYFESYFREYINRFFAFAAVAIVLFPVWLYTNITAENQLYNDFTKQKSVLEQRIEDEDPNKSLYTDCVKLNDELDKYRNKIFFRNLNSIKDIDFYIDIYLRDEQSK